MTGPNHDRPGVDPPIRASQQKSFWTSANLAGLTVIGMVFVLLATLSWRKWPDVVIDFGLQLYIPWRISEGAVLYRDLFYFGGGPVSQYFNAALFKLFGVSFSTLIAANLLFSLALLGLVYRRFLAVSDTLTATMICVGVEVTFMFSQFTGVGNYNYIAPYAHEIFHGLLLSLLAVSLLADWLNQQRQRAALWAGFCAGLVFLTKPDVFLALGACTAATLVLGWWQGRRPGFIAKSAALFGLAMLVAPAFFFLIFLRVEDWQTSLRSVVFGWLPVFQRAVTHNPYYVASSGMDHPAAHLREMATQFICAVLVLSLYVILFRQLQGWKSRQVNSTWVVWLVLVAPLLVWAWKFQWALCGSSLPFWCLTVLIVVGWRLKSPSGARPFNFVFLWGVFALFLLAKMGLYPRIFHYGFALAMPAFVITLYFLLWLLPALLENRWAVPRKYLRTTLTATLLIGFVVLIGASQDWYRQKVHPVGKGGDVINTFGAPTELAGNINVALDWVDKNIPPDGTFAAVPVGVTLNYLSRRVNPTPCLFWDPVCMTVFGEKNMTARFEAAPPDYVLVEEQDQRSFGLGYFGTTRGFGMDLMNWLKQNYQPILIVGAVPLRDGRFGIEIYKRISPVPEESKMAPDSSPK